MNLSEDLAKRLAENNNDRGRKNAADLAPNKNVAANVKSVCRQ
jgi:hypothetical protein